MALCPLDLEFCDRPECAGVHCPQTGELQVTPCVKCGYLIVLRGAGMCVDCISVELSAVPEA